jgi:hypothetical protein
MIFIIPLPLQYRHLSYKPGNISICPLLPDPHLEQKIKKNDYAKVQKNLDTRTGKAQACHQHIDLFDKNNGCDG